MSSTLTIRHTAEDGTLLYGSSRGDGAWEAIKEAQQRYKIRGWKYFRSLRMIGVSYSRDRAPMLSLIDRTADVLREAGFYADASPDPFNAVIMNPPFTETGDRHAWTTHIELAWRLLRPGGQLRAILPTSLEFGRQRRITAIRDLIQNAGGRWWSPPADAFASVGTCVRTVVAEATRQSEIADGAT